MSTTLYQPNKITSGISIRYILTVRYILCVILSKKCQGGVVEAGSQSKERGGEDREEGRGDRQLIDVKLVFEMEEETRRRTSEAAR